MDLTWEELISRESNPFLLINSRSRDVDIFIHRFSDKDFVVRKIQGKNCNSTQELFKEFSSALQFPYYFGYNWDAFDECMSDLAWLGEKEGYLIFITNSELLLTKDLDIFIDILKAVVDFWKEKNKVFKVVFQAEDKVNSTIESISEKRILTPLDDIK